MPYVSSTPSQSVFLFLYYQTIFYKRYKVSSFPIFVATACCSINCFFFSLLSLSCFIVLFFCLSFNISREIRGGKFVIGKYLFLLPSVETKTITSVISSKWFEDWGFSSIYYFWKYYSLFFNFHTFIHFVVVFHFMR